MCGVCGCDEQVPSSQVLASHDHETMVTIEQDILSKNNQFAQANRRYLQEKQITAINFMSSPGSGKTTLLSRTIADLKRNIDINVIVADQQTDYDAKQLESAGAKTVQINTGKVCHLDAHRVGHVIEDCNPSTSSILFIENIGNLVCPAAFDLGETYKVVLLSVTEGDNKPLKYPDMFRHADLLILTKIDLLPHVEFDTNQCMQYAKRINSSINVLSLSSTTGLGLDAWYQWLGDASQRNCEDRF